MLNSSIYLRLIAQHWRHNDMTRISKIYVLVQQGVPVKFHYNQYSKQKRLIIDEIEDFKYNNTTKDQLLAGEYIDLLY